MNKFSIITINLNNATGLERTINSVLNQTYNNYEFIVIDGASTDRSIDVINDFKDRITYWVSESDNGIYNAMNKGLLKASGEYCFFLNSGDLFADSEVLSKISRLMPTEDILFGNLIVVIKDKVIGKIRGKNVLTFMDLYKSVIKHQSTFIKTELFAEYGLYNENLRIVADWEYFLKLIGLLNKSYKYLDIDIAYFDNDGISNNSEQITKREREWVLKEYINPLILEDYRYFEKFNFIGPAFEYKWSRFILRIIAKLAKDYNKLIRPK